LLENQYPALPFGDAVVDHFTALAVWLQRQGRPPPVLDLMIAATACRHGLILVTLNARGFAGIPGLVVDDWSAASA
jgi:predicted nucleic acid-binding protein